MPDISEVIIRESITGMERVPCLVFGNGVEIETKVWKVSSGEGVGQRRDGRLFYWIKKHKTDDSSISATETLDIVKIHFVPKTSMHDRAYDPYFVPAQERHKIAKDCLVGFMVMAKPLKAGEVDIHGHHGDDFYLFADTNPQFAAFLRGKLGFRGTSGGEEAWIKVSEFVSDENLQLIEESYNTVCMLEQRKHEQESKN